MKRIGFWRVFFSECVTYGGRAWGWWRWWRAAEPLTMSDGWREKVNRGSMVVT